jgi:hypothetical protein
MPNTIGTGPSLLKKLEREIIAFETKSTRTQTPRPSVRELL